MQQTDSQTDRQSDSQTVGQTDSQTVGQTDSQTVRLWLAVLLLLLVSVSTVSAQSTRSETKTQARTSATDYTSGYPTNAPGCLTQVAVNFSAAPTSAETIKVFLDSRSGATSDSLMASASTVAGATTNVAFLFSNAAPLNSGDQVRVTITNVSTNGNATVTSWVDTGGSPCPGSGGVQVVRDGVALAEAIDTHNLLSATHSDTTAASPTRGDVVTAQGVSAAWARLAKGTQYQTLQGGVSEPGYDAVHLDQATAVTGVLPDANVSDAITLTNITQITNRAISDTTGILAVARGGSGADLSGTGGANQFVKQSTLGGTLTVGTIADADVPDSITLTNLTQVTTRAIADTTGTLLEPRGGTGQTTYTLGDTLYSSAANTLAKLAGNITTTKQFLSQTGTGAVSAAPVWAQPAFADVSGSATDAQVPNNITIDLASTVTTNANLTGPITSTGNATAVAAQTGTGSTFVMQASPTLTTPNIGIATGTSLTTTADLEVSGYAYFKTNAGGNFPTINFGLALGTNHSNGLSEADFINSNTSGQGFRFYQQTAAAADTLLVTFLNTGKSGFNGITTPDAPVHAISDTAYATGVSYAVIAGNKTTTTKRLALGYDATIDAGVIQAMDEGTSFNKNLVLNPNAGNVGIRTTTPQSTFEVPDGFYAQFSDNNAGAPLAADCDTAAELGRRSMDTTNNRVYYCNGATRLWDYVALTD